MDINFDEIKKLVIKSLFVDDDFYDLFVLKGGNALSIAYKLSNRSSKDVDVSMAKDFLIENEEVLKKLENAFEKIFKNSEYKTFDFKLLKRPMSIDCFLQNDFTHFCNQKYTILQSEYINNKTFKSIDI